MNESVVAYVALVFSALSVVLSWRSYRRAGPRVDCSLEVGDARSSGHRRGVDIRDPLALALRVRNKGMASIQVSEIHVNVGRAWRDRNRGVYTLGQRIPPHQSDDPVFALPALIDVELCGPTLGHVISGFHTENWTLATAELFTQLEGALAICDQRLRAVLVLGDGREITSNSVRMSRRADGSWEVATLRWQRARY